MKHPFTEAFRAELAAKCGEFSRAAPGGPAPHLKHAAVAITLVESAGNTAFVLTRRVSTLRAHGGQWALPGGRCDEGESYAQAALREVMEEVGLTLEGSDVLGTLDDYPTRSGYLITPVVLWARDSTALHANPTEVASVHRIELDQIAHPDAVDFISIPESTRQVIRIRINGNLIHAPTAAVLYQFRELLAGRHTRVDDLEQPLFAWR